MRTKNIFFSLILSQENFFVSLFYNLEGNFCNFIFFISLCWFLKFFSSKMNEYYKSSIVISDGINKGEKKNSKN